MNAFFIRREDYWLYPLSLFGVLMVTTMLYVGATQLRLVSGLIGFIIFYFMYYVIRKNYSKRLAAGYLLTHFAAAIALATFAYLLTN